MLLAWEKKSFVTKCLLRICRYLYRQHCIRHGFFALNVNFMKQRMFPANAFYVGIFKITRVRYCISLVQWIALGGQTGDKTSERT